MAWPIPEYSRSQVNRAGRILRKWEEPPRQILQAFKILTNWRSSHGYPINTFQATLRQKLKRIDSEAIVAQRLKRTPSILAKLDREPSMALANMQDIAGLRAVVSSLVKVRHLEQSYLLSRFAHVLRAKYDYIEDPKPSGYRSVHLVYRYQNDKVPAYDDLFIELQIRTRAQHAWATAVETMGTFLNEPLKASEGPDEWLDFFAAAGAAFAVVEHTPRVPGFESMGPRETFRLVKRWAKQLDVVAKLQAYAVATDVIVRERSAGAYQLIVLNIEEKSVRITPYARDRVEEASESYTEIERKIAGGAPLQAVLVSTSSIDVLRRAYPNYFLDTKQFVRRLQRIIAMA